MLLYVILYLGELVSAVAFRRVLEAVKQFLEVLELMGLVLLELVGEMRSKVGEQGMAKRR